VGLAAGADGRAAIRESVELAGPIRALVVGRFDRRCSKVADCSLLLSEDFQHGQDLDGLRVIDPFRVSPENGS
jgi:hypothetical protein